MDDDAVILTRVGGTTQAVKFALYIDAHTLAAEFAKAGLTGSSLDEAVIEMLPLVLGLASVIDCALPGAHGNGSFALNEARPCSTMTL